MKTKVVLILVTLFLWFGCNKVNDQTKVHNEHLIGVTNYISNTEQEFNSLFSDIKNTQESILNYSSEIIDLNKANDVLELEIIKANDAVINTSEAFVNTINKKLSGQQFIDTLYYKSYNGFAEIDMRKITSYYYDENGSKIILSTIDEIIDSRKYEK